MFGKVLIANRGEIAVRVAQGLREMGIASIAVYAEPDAAAPHVALADEAYPLGGVRPGETYLRGDAIVEIAREHGAEAIHPGYGFLAENADFARACADAGLVFIGPRPEVIRAMGDKVIAKRRMEEAGVPVVPGASETDPGALAAAAERIGFPVLVKAAAGGGGRGMRVVNGPDDLDDALRAAGREAAAAFGDARVFLERYVPRARHVEVQIFGDEHGHVVQLGERDCSVQRRYQKIIEEAPAPGLRDALRAELGATAVRAARAIGYTNAGTVEFMLDDEGRFYFLEVNTRLQVEHPVTEAIVDRDLVQAQIAVAAGEPLPFGPEEITPAGHAIECRVYAEDPANDFLPSTGRIETYEPPLGPGIRVDSGVAAGSTVTVHYDPLLAKVIARAATRDGAITRMLHALERFVALGVTTNVDFLRAVIDHPAFRAGDVHTGFLGEHAVRADGDAHAAEEALVVAALATAVGARGRGGASPADGTGAAPGPWADGGAWRVLR